MTEDEDDITVLFLKKNALLINFYTKREGGVAGKTSGGSGVWARLFMPTLVTTSTTAVVVDTNWGATKGAFCLELGATRRACIEEEEDLGPVIYRRRPLSIQSSQRPVRSWVVAAADDDDDELINNNNKNPQRSVVTMAILHALRAASSSRQNDPFAAPQLVSTTTTVVEVLRNLSNQSLGYPANKPSMVAKTQCLTLTRVSMNKRARTPLATALTRHALLPLLTNISTFTFTSNTHLPPLVLPATPPSLLV
ncbi:hypothetical protein Tco_0104425 [Tanacetum coccineum]